MKARVLTGFLFTITVLFCIFVGKWAMLVLLGFALFQSFREMYDALHTASHPVHPWCGYLFCLFTVLYQVSRFIFPNAERFLLPVILLPVFCLMVDLIRKDRIAVNELVNNSFPILYPGLFYMGIMEFLHIESPALFTIAFGITFFAPSINDMFALFVGRAIGKHKLAPVISPKKTIEGAVAGVIACILFCVFIPQIIRGLFFWSPATLEGFEALPGIGLLLVIGLFTGIFCQFGDLIASMIKRYCNIKDFGTLLPGHGGVMDRLDSVLVAGLVCYVFLILF